jgi:hypothetical protein
MLVSLRPIAVLRRTILRPAHVAWRARQVRRTLPAPQEVKPKIGFFDSYQQMLEHQADLMIRSFDR